MKILKFIIGAFFILAALGMFLQKEFIAGLFSAVLGIIILPPIADNIKNRFKLWNTRAVRYLSYFGLLLVVALTTKKTPLNNPTSTSVKDEVRREQDVTSNSNIAIADTQSNLQTCNMMGDTEYVIPDLIAADIYPNFQDKGFKIDKQITNEATTIYCVMNTANKMFNVRITGCSPDEIIEISASGTALNTEANNDLRAFLGYVATLQYKNSEPETARAWVEENYKNHGAKKTIGDVTFEIGTKNKNGARLIMSVEGSPKATSGKVPKYNANGEKVN